MDDAAREEIARLKEHLHRVAQVSELRRKMGEDTEFEMREMRRKHDEVDHAVTDFVRVYKNLSPDDPALPYCDTALKAILKALGRVI